MKKVTLTSPAKFLFFLFFGLLAQLADAQTVYLASANNNSSVIEGNSLVLNVKLNFPIATNVTVNVTTTPDTADVADYTPINTTVTIPAGQTVGSTTVSVQTTNDFTIESNEHMAVTATATSGNTANTSYSYDVYITDNDTIPDFSLYTNVSIIESNSSNFYYFLSNPYNADIIIHWTSAAITAGSSDFPAINTTTTISAGQTSGYFTVATSDDALAEPDETFALTATITSGNTTNTSVMGVVTIRDNDTTPTFSMTTNYSASESQDFSFYIRLDRPYNSNVVVQLDTANGTAGANDYTPTSMTKTFSPGTTQLLVSIPITEDLIDEPFETFTITGTVLSANTANASVVATAQITDNDGLPDLFFMHNYDAPTTNIFTVEEGEDLGFAIGLTAPAVADTVVQLTAYSGTAGTADYSSFTTSVTIPDGHTHYFSDSLLISTILDQLQEGDETFSITATLAPGITFYPTYTQAVVIRDNYNLNAQHDDVDAVAEVSSTFPLLANDTLQGLPLNTSDATVTLAPNAYGVTANAQGIISIPNTLDIGSYPLEYTICETANPANCDTASISLNIISPLEVTFNLTYSDYNGDGYTSVGDIITYQFNVTNNGNAPITNIHQAYIFNLTVTGGPIASLNAGATDTTTFTAIHIVTQDDINFGFYPAGDNMGPFFIGEYYGYDVSDSATLQNPFTLNTSDGIRVKAFVDTNGNGIQEVSEINFPLGHFEYEINGNGTIHNLYSTPYYIYESNPTTSYDLTYQVDSDYASHNSCSVSYPNVTVNPGSGITTYNFPITVTPYQDLMVNMHNFGGSPRPGFVHYSYITYTNNSNVTVPAGTLTFVKDPAISIVDVCDGNALLNANGFTYDFSYLLPYETRVFWMRIAVPNIPIVTLGQTLTNSVSITVPAGDILPSNNTSTITETIVGSYDPNDKVESHGGRIVQSSFSANDYLTYTIRFENTGTANAINVKVSDILDAKLDENSLKMITASHTYALERIGNSLTWNFFGIDLPPSVTDTNIGHGYIVFQVKPKPGYAIGDIIENTAAIYFDFNPAIITNTWTTEFVSSLDNNQFAFADLACYPNPVANTLFVSNASPIDTIEISTVLGQKAMLVTVNDLQAEIGMSGLEQGIYFVKINSGGQEKIIKVLKD